jgi:hypothetical protein
VFARQANIAHGHQQVNNGIPLARAGNQDSGPNELLEAHGERVDAGAAPAASGRNTNLAALGAVNRAPDGPRKARSSKNADRGGQRQEWRQMIKRFNSALRAQREALQTFLPD